MSQSGVEKKGTISHTAFINLCQVQPNFHVKLLDFSIARIKDTAREERTYATNVVGGQGPGTYAYMAPEVFTSSIVKRQPAADIYALGLIIVENANNGAVNYKEYKEIESAMLNQLVPKGLKKVPPTLRTITESCLSFEPTSRPRAIEVGKILGQHFDEKSYYGHTPVW